MALVGPFFTGGVTCARRAARVDYRVRTINNTASSRDPGTTESKRRPTVTSTAGDAAGQRTVADRLGITAGMVVQEIGRDDDVDTALVDAVVERTGGELTTEDSDDVVDVVLLWFREDDGDLVDALMDARTRLDSAGSIWVLTPKSGRPGHVEPSDIIDAAPTAGLSQTSTVPAGQDWTASRLVVPKGQRAARR